MYDLEHIPNSLFCLGEEKHLEQEKTPVVIYHNYYYKKLQLPWIFKVFVRQKCQSELKTREKEQKEKVNQTKALDCLHIYNWKKKSIELIEGMKPRNSVSSWVPRQ